MGKALPAEITVRVQVSTTPPPTGAPASHQSSGMSVLLELRMVLCGTDVPQSNAGTSVQGWISRYDAIADEGGAL